MILPILFNIAGEKRCRVTPYAALPEHLGGNQLYLINKWEDNESLNIAADINGTLVPVWGTANHERCIGQLEEANRTLEAHVRLNVEDGIKAMVNLERNYPYGHYAKAVGLFDQVLEARKLWDAEKARRAAVLEAQKAEEQNRKNEEFMEKMSVLTKLCKEGEYLGPEDFKALAKFHGLWISPRTLGWINDCLDCISATKYIWAPRKRGQRQSDAVMKYYHQLQRLCAAWIEETNKPYCEEKVS